MFVSISDFTMLLKDISNVWSGSVTPGRILWRVYKYLENKVTHYWQHGKVTNQYNLYYWTIACLTETKLWWWSSFSISI